MNFQHILDFKVRKNSFFRTGFIISTFTSLTICDKFSSVCTGFLPFFFLNSFVIRGIRPNNFNCKWIYTQPGTVPTGKKYYLGNETK